MHLSKLRKLIASLNDKIDKRIIEGKSYADLAIQHRRAVKVYRLITEKK